MSEEHTQVSAKQQGSEYAGRSIRDIAAHERNRIIGLGLIEILIAVIGWFYTSRALNVGLFDFSGGGAWVFLLLATLIFWLMIAWKAIVSMLINPSWIAISLHALASLAIFIWFYFSIWSVLAYLVFVAGIFAFHQSILSEAGNRLRFSAIRIIHFGRGYAIVGSLLTISILFYSMSAAAQQESDDPAQSVTKSLANAVNQTLELRFDTYHPEETVDQFLQRMIIEGIRSPQQSEGSIEDLNPADFLNPLKQVEVLSTLSREAFLAELPEDVRNTVLQNPDELQTMFANRSNAAVEAQFENVRNQLLSALKLEASGSTRLGEIVETLISEKMGSQLRRYVTAIPPVLALVLFLVLNIFSLLYRLLLDGLVGGVFALLKLSKVVVMKRHEVTAEYPSL